MLPRACRRIGREDVRHEDDQRSPVRCPAGSVQQPDPSTHRLGRFSCLNMAADSWVPHQYRYLSTRLVTQRGIQLMGFAAFGILVVTGGRGALLVVLYSILVM